jgi:hypothetical protein
VTNSLVKAAMLKREGLKRRLSAAVRVPRLRYINRRSRDSIVGDAPCVVSLTTYDVRVNSVYFAIESIGEGSVLPRRIILWIDDPEILNALPDSLKRLQARGLEVLFSERNYGPHTKYYPYLLSQDGAHGLAADLVTADDDILYPRNWLADLVTARSRSREGRLIFCHRAKRVKVVGDGLAPYIEWADCRDVEPSVINFATGVSGVLYPAEFLRRLLNTGAGFLDSCPRADDVWLHYQAVVEGFRIQQVSDVPVLYPFVPRTQASGLVHANVLAGENDRQIANVYTPETVGRIVSEASNIPSRD